MSGTAKPKLVYFANLGGRAEPIIMLLKLAGVEFDDERYKLGSPEYVAAKSAGEFGPTGGLPVWIDPQKGPEGKKYYETNFILRMLGARYGYYSTDPDTMWEIDVCMDKVEQVLGRSGIAPHSKYMLAILRKDAPDGGGGPSEEIAQGMLQMYQDLSSFAEEKLQGHGQRYLAGTDQPTIADFRYFVQFSDSIYNEAGPLDPEMRTKIKNIINSMPCLKRWIEEAMMSLLSDHLASRPQLLW
mmetsp:Transcript_130074/g.324263  ORF Transcript_130074/g.324263 Transcript_130074/m.324263 type:complete len:242 (+) Transcript_130074:64-789(+)